MKDITISGNRIKKELIYLLCCVCLAFLMNVFAIIIYNTKWSELFSQLHIVLVLAALIYIIILLIRLAATGIYKILKK